MKNIKFLLALLSLTGSVFAEEVIAPLVPTEGDKQEVVGQVTPVEGDTKEVTQTPFVYSFAQLTAVFNTAKDGIYGLPTTIDNTLQKGDDFVNNMVLKAYNKFITPKADTVTTDLSQVSFVQRRKLTSSIVLATVLAAGYAVYNYVAHDEDNQ